MCPTTIGPPLPPEGPQSPEPSSEFSFVKWLGRVFRWLTGTEETSGLPSQEKTEKTFQNQLLKDDISTFQHQQLQVRFTHNYDAILKLKAKDISHLKVIDGKIISQEQVSPEEEQNQVKEFIRQTHRQAWGKLIDAKYGLAVQEEQLQRLNRLNDHLAKEFPGLLQNHDPAKPLAILSSHYGKKPAVKMDAPLMKEQERVGNQVEAAVTQLAQKNLSTQALTDDETGINPTEFVTHQATGAKLALRKSEKDAEITRDETRAANREAGKNVHLKLRESQLSFLGGFHEFLASNLNILLNGRLGVPLAAQGKGTSIHAFVESEGSLNAVIERFSASSTKQEVLESLEVGASQRLIFAEVMTKNADAHGGNILISPSLEPIPIDFGRILSDSKLRAAYLDFPCLDMPVNEQDKVFFQKLNVEETVQTLTNALHAQYPSQFADPKISRVLIKKLEMLKARLYMIQICLDEGFNQRQLIALDLPPLSDRTEVEYDKTIAELQPIIDKHQADDDQEGVWDLKEQAYDFAKQFTPERGFDKAWKAAYDPTNNRLQVQRFKNIIREEIAYIASYPKDQLRTQREIKLYSAANLDIS